MTIFRPALAMAMRIKPARALDTDASRMPQRTQGGFRLFSAQDVERIQFIRRAPSQWRKDRGPDTEKRSCMKTQILTRLHLSAILNRSVNRYSD